MPKPPIAPRDAVIKFNARGPLKPIKTGQLADLLGLSPDAVQPLRTEDDLLHDAVMQGRASPFWVRQAHQRPRIAAMPLVEIRGRGPRFPLR